MKKIFSNKLFLLGLLIRVIIMPFTGHFDIRGINFAVYNLPFNRALNVYEIVEKGTLDHIVKVNFEREYFVYPPLTYFTLGSAMYILKPFYGSNFTRWINGDGSSVNWVLEHPNVFRYLFLMKVPYLIFDLGLLILLIKFFNNKNIVNKAALYWWLNPISIYLIYLWGQFDIIPAFFTLLSFYLATKKRPLKSALFLGIAAAYKNYPLLLLPILALSGHKNFKSITKTILVGLTPYVVTVLPFLSSKFFRDTVIASRHSQKLMDFLISIGGHEGIYPFIVGYIVILFATAYLINEGYKYTYVPYISVLMWYYATVNFHHQWFLWVMPFLVYALIAHKKLMILFIWTILLFFLRLTVIQADVTFELFAWISPAFNDIPKTRSLMGYLYDINRLRNIVNSLYMGTSLFLIPYLFNQAKRKS